jgi:hypothetical protein
MQFSVASINEMASQKNIRFLTFKIGLQDKREFEELALATKARRKGAFNFIKKALFNNTFASSRIKIMVINLKDRKGVKLIILE